MKKANKPTLAIIMRLALAALCTALLFLIPFAIRDHFYESERFYYPLIGIATLILTAAIGTVSYIRTIKFGKQHTASVKEQQDYFMKRRDEAELQIKPVIMRMTMLQKRLLSFTGAVTLSALIVAVSAGIGALPWMLIYPFLALYGVFTRQRLFEKTCDFSSYSKEAEYPRIYALAHRAASALGLDGDIRILFSPSFNAGIAQIENVYSLEIGAPLLDILSEDELYQILLHEFAHLTEACCPDFALHRMFLNITEHNRGPLTWLCDMLFCYVDTRYVYEYTVFRITASIANERIADRAIPEHGNTRTAANALAKLAFHECFERELETYIPEHYYEPKEARCNQIDVLCAAFRRAVKEREVFWRELLKNEIQSRSASHPIFRARLEALGENEYTVDLTISQGEYREECERAKKLVNDRLHEMLANDYEQARKENYLKPLETVEGWEKAGSPIDPCAARPVLDALASLNRTAELEALCDKIIEGTESPDAAAHAYIHKGFILLDRYDKRGIEYIYRAIEANSNYTREGIDRIGAYCCMAGLTDELEEYRRRAPIYQQKRQDETEMANGLKKSDNLCRESMPDGMHREIIDYILKVGEDSVERIYYIRKIGSETFFTTAVVIEFTNGTEETLIERVLEKVYNYLDTYPNERHFTLYVYSDSVKDAVKSVEGACVYDKKAVK